MTLSQNGPITDLAERAYTRARIAHWDRVATDAAGLSDLGDAYHRRLVRVYRAQVAPNQRVLEIGCGQGDLLAALEPAFGVGVDFSHAMVRKASGRHPNLRFVQADGVVTWGGAKVVMSS